ncbi:hypothetical protein HAX54_032246 [Datura stramonium]|uniref:Uncharacterized protein n=1 Tax=Datura stramonium TaxID=4076 RepID=A0ABS8RM27_DATST|nr:hypothetical protein [Datura stramonium]
MGAGSQREEVRDQLYDEKANTITIVVVCCSPERIRPKGPEKPKEPEKPKGPEKPKEPEKKPKVVTFDEKPKEPEKPKDKAKEPEKPKGQEKLHVIDISPRTNQKIPRSPRMVLLLCTVATPWISEPMMMMPPVQGYPQAAHGCVWWRNVIPRARVISITEHCYPHSLLPYYGNLLRGGYARVWAQSV